MNNEPTKICNWCGKEFTKKPRTSNWHWDRTFSCSIKCSIKFRTYGCCEADMPPDEVKFCLACDKQLIRKEGECNQSWSKRKYCDKACSGTRSRYKKVQPPKKSIPAHEAVGCKVYKPGTPEFEKVAELYR